MSVHFEDSEIKLIYYGDQQITRVYYVDDLVYSAAQLVTYYLDTVNGKSTTKEMEVEYDESCTKNLNFTPTKSGYPTFHGWRGNSTASSTVYGKGTTSDKIMGTDPIELFAVFKKTIEVTFDSHSPSAPTPVTGDVYYNNGNVLPATFTFPVGTSYASTGWRWLGWSGPGNTSAHPSVFKDVGETIKLDASTIFYGLYEKQITLRFLGNGSTKGSTANMTPTIYWSGSEEYASNRIALPACGFEKTAYRFLRWAQGGTNGTQIPEGGEAVVKDSTDFYAIWQAVQTSAWSGDFEPYGNKELMETDKNSPLYGKYKLGTWDLTGFGSLKFRVKITKNISDGSNVRLYIGTDSSHSEIFNEDFPYTGPDGKVDLTYDVTIKSSYRKANQSLYVSRGGHDGVTTMYGEVTLIPIS